MKLTHSQKKVRKAKRKRKSAEEKLAARIKREHTRLCRQIFRGTGFIQLTGAVGKNFDYAGARSEFDDIFVLENVMTIVEYTTSNESHVSGHLKNKKIIYDKILDDPVSFMKFFRSTFPDASTQLNDHFRDSHFEVRIVYCSRYALKGETKDLVPNVVFLDYHCARYFSNVVDTIRLSARYEILDFLRVPPSRYSNRTLSPQSRPSGEYSGSVLPEAHSHFPDGFKVVSFYVDADALLERAYVLRRDGWRVGSNLYQRMISKAKVASIRNHLLDGNGVFINNIIATLPKTTKLVNADGDTINPKLISSTTPGTVKLASEFNSIGLIDGQHRVFSYHEGGVREAEMSVLRKQQNLLLTGIMFPETMTANEIMQFQAKLFLEINANQTNAKSDLKQEIGLMLTPYSGESIARRVINLLNDEPGPLRDQFERYFFDKDKLKTTTIVTYALRHLVKIDGDESLFRVWEHPAKLELKTENNDALLAEYVSYCVREINLFFSSVKDQYGSSIWHPKTKRGSGILTTTFINGFVACLRSIVRANALGDFHYYKRHLTGVSTFTFHQYKSSQYGRMGTRVFDEYFPEASLSLKQLNTKAA